MSSWMQFYIQRASAPLKNVVNERLAKRGGPIGRMFTFFQMGERQWGGHVIEKFLRSYMLRWYNGVQMVTTGGSNPLRDINMENGKGFSVLNEAPFFLRAAFLLFFLWADPYHHPENADDVLSTHEETYDYFFPNNVLNERISAHYWEINRIYHVEMTKKYIKERQKIASDRSKCSDYEKKMRYAQPKYQYQKIKNEHESSLIEVHDTSE